MGESILRHNFTAVLKEEGASQVLIAVKNPPDMQEMAVSISVLGKFPEEGT